MVNSGLRSAAIGERCPIMDGRKLDQAAFPPPKLR
jgi:hypothetical protein